VPDRSLVQEQTAMVVVRTTLPARLGSVLPVVVVVVVVEVVQASTTFI
jgi:hypothetical protein